MQPAIVGVGATEMSLAPGGIAADLAVRAVDAALRDAGIDRSDVDGLLVASSQGVRPDRVSVGLARSAGLADLRLLEHIEIKGASTLAMIQRAMLSVAAGLAHTVVCVFADAPLRTGGRAGSTYAASGGTAGVRGLERASGLLGSVPTFALLAARYLTVTGTAPEALGAVAIAGRLWAIDNPAAVLREPLDIDDYLASPMVSTPLRRLDCARPVNGAAAVVVSSRRPNAHRPIALLGTGAEHPLRTRLAPDESWFGGGARAAADALAAAGLQHDDIDVLELYDPFTVVTLCLLEEYGFAKRGDAGAMALAGDLGPGGSRPTNTGGGQVSGFYLQGMTPLLEAIDQLRGTAGDRQLADTRTAFVAGIGGRMDHHACLVLGVEGT